MPGTVLRNRTVDIALLTTVSVPNVKGYQLLYSTTDVFGGPITTVTTVMVPSNASSHKLVACGSFSRVSGDRKAQRLNSRCYSGGRGEHPVCPLIPEFVRWEVPNRLER